MTTKTDPNQNYTIKEFYIKVKGEETRVNDNGGKLVDLIDELGWDCLLYTSPSPRDGLLSRMPSSA